MSIESVMLSNHLILCHPLLLLLSIFPSIRVFSNESALLIRWPRSYGSLFVIFWLISIPFKIVSVLFYIPSNSVQEFQFLHILPSLPALLCFLFVCCFVLFVLFWEPDVRWYFTVVLFCIFLMINDVEHFFKYLLAVRKSLDKCFIYLPIFNQIIYLLLIYRNFRYTFSVCLFLVYLPH